jgi:hypothetical protein
MDDSASTIDDEEEIDGGEKNHCAKKTVFLSCAQSKWHRTCERGGRTMAAEEKEGRRGRPVVK